MFHNHNESANPVSQLSFSEVSKVYGQQVVLDQISFTVRNGEKVGVVGENGSGKSTLLRLIAGAEAPDNGEATVVADGGIGHIGQTLGMSGDLTVADAIDVALADLRDLERRMRAAEETLQDADDEQLSAYGDLLNAYEARGGYEADARVAAAMHALGLADIGLDRQLGTLSGGEQSRLGIACVLASAPELLLLDEPTNHLDESAMAWLEDQLRSHTGTVVAVTHDRVFLEKIATTILEVDADRHTVNRYGNGWDGYLSAKAAARRRWEQDYQDWLDDIARSNQAAETGAVVLAGKIRSDTRPRTAGHRRSHEAGLSAQVRNARERLRRLETNPVPRPPDPLNFAARFTTTGQAKTLDEDLTVEMSDVTVAGRLDIGKFTLAPGQRMLLTGPNGAGKTTLLRVLAGELTPDAGTVRRPRRVGYLRQELPEVPPGHNVLRAFADGLPGLAEEYGQALASLGLFQERDFDKPVSQLSIGQQRRLELARMVTRPVDLLILDEPTNHLSLALVGELEQALNGYDGTLLVVSHDRRFRRSFDGSLAELRDGRLTGVDQGGSAPA